MINHDEIRAKINKDMDKILNLLGPVPDLTEYHKRVALIQMSTVFDDKHKQEMLADLRNKNEALFKKPAEELRKRVRVKKEVIEVLDDDADKASDVVKKEVIADDDADQPAAAGRKKARRDESRPASMSLTSSVVVSETDAILEEKKREEEKSETKDPVLSPQEKAAQYRHQLSTLQRKLTEITENFKKFETEKLEKMNDEPPKNLEDCITSQLYDSPVTTSCGHTFSKDSIKDALAVKPECPTCRKPLPRGTNFPLNSALVPFIDAYTEKFKKDNIHPKKTAFDAEANQLKLQIEEIKRQLGEVSPEELDTLIAAASGATALDSKLAAFTQEMIKLLASPEVDVNERRVFQKIFDTTTQPKLSDVSKGRIIKLFEQIISCYVSDASGRFKPAPGITQQARHTQLTNFLKSIPAFTFEKCPFHAPNPVLAQPRGLGVAPLLAPRAQPYGVAAPAAYAHHPMPAYRALAHDAPPPAPPAEPESPLNGLLGIANWTPDEYADSLSTVEGKDFIKRLFELVIGGVTFSHLYELGALTGRIEIFIKGHRAPFSEAQQPILDRAQAFVAAARTLPGTARMEVIQAFISVALSVKENIGLYRAVSQNRYINYLSLLFTPTERGGAGWNINQPFAGRAGALQVEIFKLRAFTTCKTYELSGSRIRSRRREAPLPTMEVSPLLLILLNAQQNAIKDVLKPLLRYIRARGGVEPNWEALPREGEFDRPGIDIKYKKFVHNLFRVYNVNRKAEARPLADAALGVPPIMMPMRPIPAPPPIDPLAPLADLVPDAAEIPAPVRHLAPLAAPAPEIRAPDVSARLPIHVPAPLGTAAPYLAGFPDTPVSPAKKSTPPAPLNDAVSPLSFMPPLSPLPASPFAVEHTYESPHFSSHTTGGGGGPGGRAATGSISVKQEEYDDDDRIPKSRFSLYTTGGGSAAAGSSYSSDTERLVRVAFPEATPTEITQILSAQGSFFSVKADDDDDDDEAHRKTHKPSGRIAATRLPDDEDGKQPFASGAKRDHSLSPLGRASFSSSSSSSAAAAPSSPKGASHSGFFGHRVDKPSPWLDERERRLIQVFVSFEGMKKDINFVEFLDKMLTKNSYIYIISQKSSESVFAELRGLGVSSENISKLKIKNGSDLAYSGGQNNLIRDINKNMNRLTYRVLVSVICDANSVDSAGMKAVLTRADRDRHIVEASTISMSTTSSTPPSDPVINWKKMIDDTDAIINASRASYSSSSSTRGVVS